MEDGEDCCRTPVGRDSRQDRPAHAGLSRASPAVSDLALQYLVSWLLVFAPTVRMSSYTSHLLHNLSSFVYTNAYVCVGGGDAGCARWRCSCVLLFRELLALLDRTRCLDNKGDR